MEMLNFFKKGNTILGKVGRLPGFLNTPDPMRGYTNLGFFEVHGINQTTGRKNKQTIEAFDTSSAQKIAADRHHLAGPYEITEIQRPRATERQIAYGKSLNLCITPEMTMIDATALICRHEDGDTLSDSISQQEFEKASALGIAVSSLCGHTLYRSAMKTERSDDSM